MALVDFKLLPGIDKQQTQVGADKRWVNSDNVRFRYGLPEKVGGWSSLLTDTIVGVARAQYYLGIMYEHGKGVEKDLAWAIQLYRFAAEQGDVRGQYALASAYTKGSTDGKGVDYIVAHMWANVAASNGSKGGAKLSDWVLNRMSPRDIQEAKSLLRTCVLNKYKNCFREK